MTNQPKPQEPFKTLHLCDTRSSRSMSHICQIYVIYSPYHPVDRSEFILECHRPFRTTKQCIPGTIQPILMCKRGASWLVYSNISTRVGPQAPSYTNIYAAGCELNPMSRSRRFMCVVAIIQFVVRYSLKIPRTIGSACPATKAALIFHEY